MIAKSNADSFTAAGLQTGDKKIDRHFPS
jgi:hypothetical protein